MDGLPTPPQPDPTDKQKKREQRQLPMRTYIGYAISVSIAFWLFQRFVLAPSAQQMSEITYSTFKQNLAAGEIVTVVISGRVLPAP